MLVKYFKITIIRRDLPKFDCSVLLLNADQINFNMTKIQYFCIFILYLFTKFVGKQESSSFDNLVPTYK